MAGKKPLFSSAPRLQIKIGENPVAYAIGFNMNMSVNVQPVNVIGAYAPISYEPTLVNLVTGSMQIVKLIPVNVQTTIKDLSGKTDARSVLTNANQNTQANSAISGNAIPEAHALQRHLDPRFIMLSESFDITLRLTQVATSLHTGVKHTSVSTLIDDQQLENGGEKIRTQIEIKDCRLTGRSSGISLGQLMNETVQWEGLITNETSFDADPEDN